MPSRVRTFERRIKELVALMEFRRAHDSARLRFVAGERLIEFPPGTYRMRAWGSSLRSVPNRRLSDNHVGRSSSRSAR